MSEDVTWDELVEMAKDQSERSHTAWEQVRRLDDLLAVSISQSGTDWFAMIVTMNKKYAITFSTYSEAANWIETYVQTGEVSVKT